MEEYRALIYAGSEDRNREYKSSFLWDRKKNGETLAKVTKSMLAMSNLRDGGHIIIGVEETGPPAQPFIERGMLEDHISTFSFDSIADFVRNYAEPPIEFNVELVNDDGKDFVIIAVKGFDEHPVICKKNYGNVLSEGIVYFRSRSGRPRSEPLRAYSDMRELMDLAVERGVRRFLALQARVMPGGIDGEEQFEQQQQEFITATNDQVDKIRSRGHWEFILRPVDFEPERIPGLLELKSLVAEHEVRLRGWYFPHLDERVQLGLNHIETYVSFRELNDAWRFYQSALYIALRGLSEDWIPEERSWAETYDIRVGEKLGIRSALFQLAEVYEFAARLAQTGVFGDRLFLKVNLVGTAERSLFYWPNEDRWLRRDYRCSVPELPREQQFQVADFVGRAREYALDHFMWLMERFGFSPPRDLFQGELDNFFGGLL